MRKVELGTTKDGLALIQAGLKPGDKVVIDGLDKLRDGSKVSISQQREKSNGKDKSTDKPAQSVDKSAEKLAEQHRKKP